MKDIKIRTGARISNILQSTLNYEQAFTELVKNSIQNGATIVSIDFSDTEIKIHDNGHGFDHLTDESGMNGFDKYFVFGNSYRQENSSPALGHMGIGGKVANDKLSDNLNTHWEIETKNKHGKIFLVKYNPTKTEFLDDYSPTVEELSDTNIKYSTGTIISIKNLDKPITNKQVTEKSITTELKNFFGHLINTSKHELDVVFNGKSIKFDYTLPGYSFDEIIREFKYMNAGVEETAKIKFNLSLLQTKLDEQLCKLDSLAVISDVKVCDFTLSNQKILDEIEKELFESGEVESLSESILGLFPKLRGFVVCDELSSVLDHTSMPAKDLSHHSLRDDHPITFPFYRVAYRVVIDVLRGYLLNSSENQSEQFSKIAENISNLILSEMQIDESVLSNEEFIQSLEKSHETKLENAKLSTDMVENLINSKINNETKHIKDPKVRETEKNNLRNSLKKNKNETNHQNSDNNDTKSHQSKETKKIRFEIKSFGEGKENIMSDANLDFGFCIYINSENYKFIELNNLGNKNHLAVHIAECLLKEISYYTENFSQKDLDKTISEFYNSSYQKINTKYLNN